MLKRITNLGFARFFINALTAPPDGRLFRRSLVNGLFAIGVSLPLGIIICGAAELMGISVDDYLPDIKFGVAFCILAVIVAPLLETLILAAFFWLIPRRLGIMWRSVISAVIWGVLHGVEAPLWFFGTVFSFFVFSYAYLLWRPKSFGRAFVAAAVPHAVVNSIACVLMAIGAGNEEIEQRIIAEQGDAETQYQFGYKIYCKTYSIWHILDEEKNLIEAATWFRKAAEQGHVEAQWKTGHILYCRASNKKGENTVQNKDYIEAVQWLYKAAEQGHLHAQTFLAQCYEYGYGVEKDDAEVIKWRRKAAAQGNSYSHCFIGRAYLDGKYGLEQNTEEGMKWLLSAAELGDLSAVWSLGFIYADGKHGVPQDKNEAIKWFRKAAECKYPIYKNQPKEAAEMVKKLEAGTWR